MRCVYGLCLLGLAANFIPQVASADPVDNHDPAVPGAATPSAQPDTKTKTGEPFVEPANEQRGFVVQVAPGGVVIPFGNFAENSEARSFGVGIAVGLLAGVYVTEHIGILGGVAGTHSHQGAPGCEPNDSDCGGATFQFPVLLQYALQNRKEGLYFQTGLGFASTYRYHSKGVGAFKASSPFDAKLGLGYRLSRSHVMGLSEPSRWSVDFYGNLDVGQFEQATVSVISAGRRVEGDIARPAMHYMAGIGVALHWTP